VIRYAVALVLTLGVAVPSCAQQAQPTPSAPQPQNTASSAGSPTFGPPLTVEGKLRYFVNESIRPGVWAVAGVYTGISMAHPPDHYPPEWRQGMQAFGRNYGDFMASWTAVQAGQFVMAAATHEDPRYPRSTRSGLMPRTMHALAFVFIAHSDSGRNRLALSHFTGAAAGGFVGNTYLPTGYDDASHALTRSALAFSGFFTSNLADEFHPDLVRIAHKLHIPFVK
jgi:hypothetical protein